MKRWQHLFRDETAGGAAEYGILIAGIALAVIATVMSIGQIVYNKLYIPASQLIR
jgi:Flp pilus assembly pilin Flp